MVRVPVADNEGSLFEFKLAFYLSTIFDFAPQYTISGGDKSAWTRRK